VLLSIGAVVVASPAMRGAFAGRERMDAPMFFLGVAFLLLETRSVTQMNAVWGATWLTSAVVFASILVMVLLGTVVTERQWLRWPAAFGALAASLVVGYLVPASALVGHGPALRLALSVLAVGLPILFASVCFTALFEQREDSAVAFGWNLLGAVGGGLLESLSVVLGLANLLLVALLAYALALLFHLRRRAEA
jgi:hypothetical protein